MRLKIRGASCRYERFVPVSDDERTNTAVELRTDSSRPDLTVGTRVEVRNRFSASWTSGFEVADATPGGYRLVRASDRYVLPAEFVAAEVRPAS